MVLSLLFPFLLFVLVLVLFRVEQTFVPRDQEQRPDLAAGGGTATADATAGTNPAVGGAVPRRLGERPLLQHLSLWETLDPAIEEEHLHAPQLSHDPQVLRVREEVRGVSHIGRQKEAVRRRRRSARRSAAARGAA